MPRYGVQSMATCEKFVILVGDKEIEIDDSIVKLLNEYVRTEMSLEQLAEKLGLDSWIEAYEFVKKIPSWIMWVPPTLWKKELEKCREAEEIKVIKI